MTNPMFSPQPNYSGVTIQIANPAVNVGPYGNAPCVSSGCINTNGVPQGYINYPQASYSALNAVQTPTPEQNALVTNPINTGYPNAYPAQYYLNNYNYADNPNNKTNNQNTETNDSNAIKTPTNINDSEEANKVGAYKMYAEENSTKDNNLNKSQNIIGDLEEREEKIQDEKKNTKETKIVALTDEYIKSLENYLNNSNDEIRLMASKEILTRLDEDKDRYDDAALNALLNKMIQDPNKLVRIAALSALNSQLASGNDYTVKLLHNIQSNPNSDKEDVLQAADILLKMSAGVEVKNIPNPAVKDKK